MCGNATLSGDDVNGFRCCLLRCLVVSRSRVLECGDLWPQRFRPLTKDSWDAIISATIHVYLYQSAMSKTPLCFSNPNISSVAADHTDANSECVRLPALMRIKVIIDLWLCFSLA